MSHQEERRAEEGGASWEVAQREVAVPLLRALERSRLTSVSAWVSVSALEVNHAMGAAEVNCYEVSNRTGDCGVRGVFPVTSLMSHSCLSNTRQDEFSKKRALQITYYLQDRSFL